METLDIEYNNINLSWVNEVKYKPTKEFIQAIINLMIAEIKMHREVHKDVAECWAVGSCKIDDMANSDHFQFVYGGLEDEDYIKSFGQIFIKVPF